MLRDFREHEPGVELETDICVIGGGAAGITLALCLAGSGRAVTVLESGGLASDRPTQALYEGSVVGLDYPDLDIARLRFFGGSTNHWEGHCRPLDAIDFERRSWVPHSGWPITRADLDPYYEAAARFCELGPVDINRIDAVEAPGLFELDPARLVNRLLVHSPPTRFGERYRARLAAASDVTVLLNANVVEIVAGDPPNAVRSVRLAALGGRTGELRARDFVLACGGIENARLLLASDGVMAAGLGNANDLVGRFFAEHVHAYTGFAVPTGDLHRHDVYHYQDGIAVETGGGTVTASAKTALAEPLQRRHGLNNCAIDIGYGYDRSPGYLTLRQVAKALLEGDLPDHLGDAIARLAGDLDGAAGGVYRRLQDQSVYWFSTNVEPAPNPDSRITLGHERDALGMRRSRLDWRLSAADKQTTRFAMRQLGEELARLGAARMRVADWLLADDSHWQLGETRYHHMGTTRMSLDPRRGVVDRDCRVHGLANLYVAGGSVFPTPGYANPTLTITALAVRLADRLAPSPPPRARSKAAFHAGGPAGRAAHP